MMNEITIFLIGGLATITVGWLLLLALYTFPIITIYALLTIALFGLGGWQILKLFIDQPLEKEKK